ncbi:MAG: hypothetical protein AAB967_01410, partial [Patescibacteria group bacterium]
MNKNKILLAAVISVLFTKIGYAQEWSGWRANVEPGITWILGSGDHIGDIWRYGENPREDITINYGAEYRPLFTASGGALSWRFEILRRAPESNRAWGIRTSFLKSAGRVAGEARVPGNADYVEGCRMFGQTLLPLVNDDEASGLSRVLCGGENQVNFFALNLIVEQAI